MRTEKVLGVLFLIGVFFKLMHWEGSGIILTLSLCGLALIYFPLGFYFFSDKSIKTQNHALSLVGGLFLSVLPVGILFKLQYWEGDQIMLLAGLISAVVLLIAIYLLKKKAPEHLAAYYRNMLTRTVVLTVVSALFFITPEATLLRIQYWDDPELARLKALHYSDYQNETYKQQHDDYVNSKKR